MNDSITKGLSFGLVSGVITTLGLIIGLNSGTHSKIAVIGGILTIAIADAMSDALGIHISEESENVHSQKQIWQSTGFTFLSKFFVALSFMIPILLFRLSTAVIICIIWGLFLISLLSYFITKRENVKPYKAILEHVSIAVLVIILTNFIGIVVSQLG